MLAKQGAQRGQSQADPPLLREIAGLRVVGREDEQIDPGGETR